jgi:hypothetical protein
MKAKLLDLTFFVFLRVAGLEVGDLPDSRFRSTKLSATIELDTKHKAAFNHCTANFLKLLLPVVIYLF